MKWSQEIVSIVFITINLLYLTAAVRQNPLKNPKICGRPQCELETKKFGFNETTRYKYEYTLHIKSEFTGSGENTSDLYFKSTVDFVFPRKCEGVISLSGTQLRSRLKGSGGGAENSSDSKAASDEYFNAYDDVPEEGDAVVEEEDDEDLHPKSKQLKQELEKNDLRFSFHDGLIGEVCPDITEPSWVLNFKKGILSSLQNTMLRFDIDYNTRETDVSGDCDVGYTLETTDDIFILIRKEKSIPSCRSRHKTHSILQSTPYTFRDDKAIWPILNSQSYCNLTIDHNIYKDITCYEKHQLVPFSNNLTGALTETYSKLSLIKEETYKTEDFLAYENENLIQRRSTLLFDHTPSKKPTHTEIEHSKGLLKQMCQYGFPNIQREFIDIFTTFLKSVRFLEYKTLTELLVSADSICNHGRNHILESLPYIQSTPSYQVMRDQIINERIPKNMANSWMTSLSFIRNPDEETLNTLYTILEYAQSKLDTEYTLGASAIVHNFCKHNSECETHPKIEKIIVFLEKEFLRHLKTFKNDRRIRDRLIVILKALGNIGFVNEDFEKQLQEIISTETYLTELRLYSVLAFRRADCFKHRQFFMNVYANMSINSEIRIYSYIQSMRCPDYQSVNFIIKILKEEKVNQVGSYVWSHLKNIAKSSSPVRIETQGLLVNEDLDDKFKMDMRKFSRNYEHSLFFDEYNFGTATDANLIFGSDSYIPRLMTFNFTADLFGESVNFFEISSRAEGFEEMVASIFGPTGPLNRELFRKKFSFLNRFFGEDGMEEANESLDNMLNFDNLRFKRSKSNPDDYVFESEDIDSSTRSKRSASKDKQKDIYDKIDKLGYKLDYNHSNPRATIAVRIFGNDLRYYSLEGMMEIMVAAKEFDPFYQLGKFLSGEELVFTKNDVFLDASYDVPLSAGLPLSIHALGASSTDLRMSGNFKKYDHPTEWHFDIEAKTKPSVSVDVITTMQSDFFYAISGIRVKSNLYSSTSVETKIKVRGPKQVAVTFNLPQDKNEIFSARSELIVMQDTEEISQNGIEFRQANRTCTWPVIGESIGLQVCSQFSVPDLSKLNNSVVHPGLLLSGPINISMVLEKSDLTAKTFAFEYKWEQQKEDSQVSVVFHTPGSAIERRLTANITRSLDLMNAALIFKNGNNKFSADGEYYKNPENRRLKFNLESNGVKNLQFEAQMNRTRDGNAYLYTPLFRLDINGEGVTGMKGTIRVNEKLGICQNDISLVFETKKLQALVRGNFIQSETTTSTNMTVIYRFHAKNYETINFGAKLFSLGEKAKTEYKGDMKLNTTAYPKMNFVSQASWLSLQGHVEGKFTHNNAPDLQDPRFTSTVKVMFARQSDDFEPDVSRTRAAIGLTIPRSKVYFRVSMKHEQQNKNGTVHNVLTGLRYSEDKEATGAFSFHFPRRNLFAMNGYVNLTVPDFNSSTVVIKILEKTQKDYFVDFNGTWFTGHTAAIKANYKDKSSRVQIYHHLKVTADSPSFESTSVNAVYRRNQVRIFGDLQATYSKDPYGVTYEFYKDPEEHKANGKFKLLVKGRQYWIIGNMSNLKEKLIEMEIHLDKIRDIFMKITGLVENQKKRLTAEVKWDANRDPTQSITAFAQYNNPSNKYYEGEVVFTYPDKAIKCSFNTYTGGPTYNGSMIAMWSINDIIKFTYDAGFLPGDNFNNWIHADLSTPFEGWKENRVSAGVYTYKNLILVNSTLLWADNQLLSVMYNSDYFLEDAKMKFEVCLGVNSTVPDIPTISAKVKHEKDLNIFNSEVDLKYKTYNESLFHYGVKSEWGFDASGGYNNVTGTILMFTPFEGYHKGGLATKLSLSDTRTVTGAASLNFDKKEFTMVLEGYVKKVTDNMLQINITTPLEKFKTIKGRFGLIESKRHAVAVIESPASSLGAEILLDIISFGDFDIKLILATPLDALRLASVVGKYKTHTVDMRGTLNNATTGFTGVWRMNNMTDFEYSYKVFTPFKDFEENGVILKIIKKDVFICEVHGKLSKHKLGVKINGEPKSRLIKQLSTKKLDLELLYDDDLQKPELEEDEDYEEDASAVDDYFTYYVDFAVDTLLWPTVTGFGDIQEIREYFIILGNIRLPQGEVEIKDRVYFPDYMHIKNVLNMNTPFPVCKDIKSIFEYDLDLKTKFLTDFSVVVTDASKVTTEVGYFINGTTTNREPDDKVYNAVLTLKTPFDLMKQIDIYASFQLEENTYKGNFTSVTENTYLELSGSLETDDNFIETSVGISLDTNVIPHYGCNLYFKKDFTNVDNKIVVEFEINDNGTNNKLHIETNWNLDPAYHIHAKGKINTNILPLRTAESALLVTKGPNPQILFDLNLTSKNGQVIAYGARANKLKDEVNIQIWTPMQNYRNISMTGNVKKQTTTNGIDQYQLSGKLYRNLVVYSVNGIVYLKSAFPVKVNLRLKPNNNGPDGVIELSVKETDDKTGNNFEFSAIEDGKMCSISGGYSMRNHYDWDMAVLVQSSEEAISRINLNAKLKPEKQGKFISAIDLETPWRELGIEKVHLGSSVDVVKESGVMTGEFDLGTISGRGSCVWTWLIYQNMKLDLESYTERVGHEPRTVKTSARYENPGRNFKRMKAGGSIDLDKKWALGVNGTFNYNSQSDIHGDIIAQLPKPVGDVHRVVVTYLGNALQEEPTNIFIEAKYDAKESQKKLNAKGSYRNVEDMQGLANVEWGVGDQVEAAGGNFHMLRKNEARKEFTARLRIPKFKDEDAFTLGGFYDVEGPYQKFVCKMNSPQSRQLADTSIKFANLENLEGFLNCTTPFLNVSWVKADFNFVTYDGETIRYVKGEWPTDSAYFDLKSKYTSENLNKDFQGTIKMELPLATKHTADISYGLKERQLMNTGYANVIYNEKQILKGQYNCKSEEKAGYEKDVVDISLENEMKPLGVRYVHLKQFSRPDFLDFDMKHTQIYELHNASNFNLTGELHIRTTETGREFKVVAIHSNRTVIINSECDSQDTKTRHNSKIQVAPDAWIGYNLILGNDTTQDNEKQNFAIELFYPKRNLSADGYYSMTHEKFDSDISFGWTMSPDPEDEKKYVRAALVWMKEPLQPNEKGNQSILLTVSHPLLQKDATLRASFSRGVVDFIRTNITIDYSNDPRHLVLFNAKVSDLSSIVGHTNYTLDVYALHEASDIEVNIRGNSAAKTSFYKALLNSYYKRGYYPQKEGMFLAKIDLNNKEVEYERTSPNREIRFWVLPYGSFPFYGLNATIWDTPDFNHTGYFYIDLDKKVTRMDINLTEDASQNLQMVGYIPDARSGYFDIWRNYDEIRIVDVASYIKMNHSRLVTGQFIWRPKLKADIKDKLRSVGESFYSSLSDGIDFWIKNSYSEAVESLNDVWETAKQETDDFIYDIKELSVLEEDFADLRQFLNSSYEANDFYIKTVVNFSISILDELALKNHIESLPQIFTELWQAMGESGKALRKSILWLIKTVQTTYDKILEAVTRFFHGDSLTYLSSLMGVGLDKYDKFMKDLHLSSIKYVEKIWNNFWNMVSNYWKSVLRRIEPHLYKFAHYIEGALWNVSKEIFDFINNRTSELAESPYFNKVTHLTQDLDKLIKDIQANDAITNFKKYSAIAWKFVSEKYFKLVPFGKELNDILMEIVEEVKSLGNLPHVKVVIEKAKEIQVKLEWLAEELQVEKRMHEVWAVVRNKIRRYTWNALETDDLYREAKTKFVFDPETGVIDLQQKLPMSWHAFNETPKFEEIPEYKFVSRIQEFFGKSNVSILSHVYGMRLHMDPKTWLPPYSGHALLIGSRHYMTFDKQFVGINTLDTLNGNANVDQCTYLLVHDFFKKNFTLLLEPSVINKNGKDILTKKLTMITNHGIIEINVAGNKIKVGDDEAPILPMRYGNLTIFRDTDVVSIESDREFMIHCNIQFDLCWFEVGGWYFGQTAGILGTMNNEPFDDMIASNKVIQTKEDELVNSWALDQCKGASKKVSPRPTANITNLCNQFFKSPHFTACTHIINPDPFISMCLDMGMNSISTILNENHPAQKGACTAALGYIEACAAAKIPLRIPDQCVHCDLPNGTYVPEGTFLKLKSESILNSTDIVFLIEAKSCNSDLYTKKSFATLLESINEELTQNKMEKNRFSIMTFGGRVPFDKPRSIVYKNEVFTYDIRDLKKQLEHVEFNNGMNNDAFQALMVASKLLFRPGVSKTVIMLPCTSCSSKEMMYDYTSMLQLLMESGINLHVLTGVEFEFEKSKEVRQFFAMDKNLVYTKKNIDGDHSLKKHTKTSSKMGLCVPLALETNGGVYSSRRLESDKKNLIKKAAALFAKRIAKTARPSPCQHCECTGHNTGVAYMSCEPCEFDESSELDYNMMDNDFDEWDFNEEEDQ